MRSHIHFQLQDAQLFKKQLLQWASQFNQVSYLNSNFSTDIISSKINYNTYSLIVAVDAIDELKLNSGKTFQQVFDIREQEVKSGKLQMNKQPATLFVYSAAADKFNPETGEVKEGYARSVIYIPYATAESTGLPAKPGAPGMPWIMNPGTHRAHIMIDPPKKN